MTDLGFLRAFMDSVGFIGAKAGNRFGAALTDAEGKTYTFEKATTDVLSFYNDWLSLWYGLGSGVVVSPIPSVTIKITKGTPTATATVSLGIGAAPLETTGLSKIGLPGAPKIPATDVTLTLTPPDLKIDLKNLAGAQVGLYKGLISVIAPPKDPVLEILLRVV